MFPVRARWAAFVPSSIRHLAGGDRTFSEVLNAKNTRRKKMKSSEIREQRDIKMKKVTTQFLIVMFAVVTLTVTNIYAQNLVRLKNGKATVRAKIAANSSVTWSISGKKFQKLWIKQKGRKGFRYEIRHGSEFLSRGHTTGIITIKSDGKSKYSIKIFNDAKKVRRVVLGFVSSGSANPTV